MKIPVRNTAYSLDLLEPRRLLAALTPGLSVTATTSTASEVDSYTVPMTAGKTLMVALGTTGGASFQAQVKLLDPSSQLVRTDTNSVGVYYQITAASSGTYTLQVSDATLAHTGSYMLTVFTPGSNFNYGEEGAEAESGRRRSAQIGPGDLDVWTITTNAGQFISAEIADNSTGENIDLGGVLFAPDGSIVSQKTSATGLAIDVNHPSTQTGTYFFVVYEPDANLTGRYGITFARLPGSQATEDPDTNTPLPPSTVRDGQLPAGDYDIFSIYADEGVTLNANISATSGNLQPEVQLFNPDGSALTSNTATSTSASVSATLPITGTYWLLLRDATAGGGGNYSIEYFLTRNDSTPGIVDDILTVNGTSAADKITLSQVTHNNISAVEVTLNGKNNFYDAEEIGRINVMAGDGANLVTDNTSINTYVLGGSGNDTIFGGSGNDTLTGGAGKNTLYGGAGDDRLNGSGAPDHMFGEDGDDRLYGNGGDDVLDGGGNVDHLYGGDGNDLLTGDSSNDKLYGEAGNDTLNGGKGSDLLDGGDGTDTNADKDPSDVVTSVEN